MMKISQTAGRIHGRMVPVKFGRMVPVNFAFFFLLPLLAVPSAAFSQALPTAEAAPISTGFALPRAAGALQYAVSASENLNYGYYGNSGVDSATNLSGDLAYISSSKVYPFSVVFSGGHGWSSSYQPSYSYLNLAMSQVLNLRRWDFVLSDSVSYLPSTPTTGLSGVPGVGDLGLNPVQVGADTGQGVLTDFSTRVGNTASASVQRPLTGKTSIQGSGSYDVMRFLGDSTGISDANGLDSDGASGSIGLSHRIDARTSVSGNFAYSRYTYGVGLPGFSSQTASLQFTRQLTRKLGISASVGPQWTTVSGSPNGAPSVNLFTSLSASYAGEFTHASLSYTRSTNSGSGVAAGALSDGVAFSAGRTFARVWSCSFSSGYTQTANLSSAALTPGATPFSFHTTVVGVQVSRALRRSLSAYASYTLQDQSSQGSAVDAFSGHSQVAGFGLTYSPSSIHLGHQ